MMRFLTIVFAVFGLLGNAAPAANQEVTVTGELVDHICFNRSGADGHGPDHAECAKSCARRGQSVALLTADGDVYLLAGPVTDDYNAALVPHMSHVVEITGELGDTDGIPTVTTSAVKHISAG